MKPSYERPVIVEHSVGRSNKFGTLANLRPVAELEGRSVTGLVGQYGSPLFVFSERRLRERVVELRDELARRFADFAVAWSYKTNYLGAVCAVFHSEGAWAEVVSGMELRKALGMDVPAPMIIFNGPAKSEADLELAFREGVTVNVDHLDEVALAEKVAERLNVSRDIGIRINIKSLPVPQWDRFGFNLEDGTALRAIQRIQRSQRLRVTGLHCHIGTFVLDPEAFRLEARSLAQFARQLRTDAIADIKSLDLGGGFASNNTLQQQYLPGEEITPALSQYIEKIALGLEEGLDDMPCPRVILETGRALVDDAGSLVATVVGNKRLSDGRRAVILNAGVNMLPTAWWYRHAVHPTQQTHGIPEPTVFFGPLCMNIDVVRDRIQFPPVHAGEHVVIDNVGAYNVTQWMQFITERPNVVMLGAERGTALIRRAEGLESLLAYEEMPDWLRAK